MKVQQVKKGDKVRVLQAGTTGLSQIPFGHIFTVASNGSIGMIGSTIVYQKGNSGATWSINSEDLGITFFTKEEIDREKKELLGQLEDLDAKLTFIKNKKVKEVDPDEYQRWRIENIIDKHKDKAPEMIYELFSR
jgi:hypothetical protein